MSKEKFLSVSIVIGCLILGGFFYATQLSKQQSIERQQQLSLDQKEAENKSKEEESKLRDEKESKEYVSKRKMECLEIYNSESEKWNNVESWSYIEPKEFHKITFESPIISNNGRKSGVYDICEIEYRQDGGENSYRYF